MAIFKKRPLAAACFLLILFVTLTLLLDASRSLAVFVAIVILLLLLIAVSFWRGLTYTRLYLLLLCIGALLGAWRGMLDMKQGEALKTYVGSTVTAEFEVVEVSYTNAYSSELTVRLHTLNGVPANSKAALLLDRATPFRIGDLVGGTVALEDLTYENFYKNQQYQYRADGCRVILVSENAEEFSWIGRAPHAFRDWCERLQLSLGATISAHVEGEAGALLNAMLLGARKELSEDTERNFRRAGVSHLLALSGLHIGILAFLCDRFFLMLGADKKLRIVATVILLLLYLMMTGCALSTVRAIFMILVLYLAFFCRENADPLTSLFLAAALILLWQPYAIFSTSYQMTVLATFGILSFGKAGQMLLKKIPKCRGVRGVLLKCLGYALSSLLITSAAGFAVLPVQWITFGELSLITPLSNMLLIPLATPLLLFGLGVLLLFPIAPFALACEWLGTLMLTLTKVLASPDVMVSLRYDFVSVILPVCLVLGIVLLLIDLGKRGWIALTPIALFAVSFVTAWMVYLQVTAGQIGVIYRADGKNEGLLLVDGKDAMLCDLSGGSTAQLQNSWQIMQNAGATELDVLMLTHYHTTQTTAFSRFCRRVTIRALWLPPPQSEKELQILLTLTATAFEEGIAVTVYDYDTPLTVFGSGRVLVSEPLFQSRSVEPAFSLMLSGEECSVYYESAALSEYRREAKLAAPDVTADLFILGAHGPVPHDTVTLAAASDTTVLISSEEAVRRLAVREDLSYVLYPKLYRFLLQ